MHSSVRQQRRNLRKLVGRNGSRKNTEPEGEMDNFQDLQLGSLTPLVSLENDLPSPLSDLNAFRQDMDRIFVR